MRHTVICSTARTLWHSSHRGWTMFRSIKICMYSWYMSHALKRNTNKNVSDAGVHSVRLCQKNARVPPLFPFQCSRRLLARFRSTHGCDEDQVGRVECRDPPCKQNLLRPQPEHRSREHLPALDVVALGQMRTESIKQHHQKHHKFIEKQLYRYSIRNSHKIHKIRCSPRHPNLSKFYYKYLFHFWILLLVITNPSWIRKRLLDEAHQLQAQLFQLRSTDFMSMPSRQSRGKMRLPAVVRHLLGTSVYETSRLLQGLSSSKTNSKAATGYCDEFRSIFSRCPQHGQPIMNGGPTY